MLARDNGIPAEDRQRLAEIKEMLTDFAADTGERKDRAGRRVIRKMREQRVLVDEPGPLSYTPEHRQKRVRDDLDQASAIMDRYRNLPMPVEEFEAMLWLAERAARQMGAVEDAEWFLEQQEEIARGDE